MKKLYELYTEQGRKLLIALFIIVVGYAYYQNNKMQFETFKWENGVTSYTTVVNGDTIEMVNGYPVKK